VNARLSREKKRRYVEELERRVRVLEVKNRHLEAKILSLEPTYATDLAMAITSHDEQLPSAPHDHQGHEEFSFGFVTDFPLAQPVAPVPEMEVTTDVIEPPLPLAPFSSLSSLLTTGSEGSDSEEEILSSSSPAAFRSALSVSPPPSSFATSPGLDGSLVEEHRQSSGWK